MKVRIMLAEMNWAKGYTSEARFLRSLVQMVNERPASGWARAKGTVKALISHECSFFVEFMHEPSDYQRGVLDALLDSVGC